MPENNVDVILIMVAMVRVMVVMVLVIVMVIKVKIVVFKEFPAKNSCHKSFVCFKAGGRNAFWPNFSLGEFPC